MVEAHTSIDRQQLPEKKKSVTARSKDKTKLVSPPDQNLIRRSFIEKLCNTSTTTINKLEAEGHIGPATKLYHGGVEYANYSISDAAKIFHKTNPNSFRKRPDAEVIAIWSQKGGVGKSSVTQHLANTYSLIGKTLVIDMDSQGDASSLLGAKKDYDYVVDEDEVLDPTIMELIDWSTNNGTDSVIQKRADPMSVIKKINDNLHVIQGDDDIAEINYYMNNEPLITRVDGEGQDITKLVLIQEVIDQLKDKYDFILIDTPPSIEVGIVNVLFAANRVVMPLEISAMSLRVMKRNVNFLKRLQNLYPAGFQWDSVVCIPNKVKGEITKKKALIKLEERYGNHDFVTLSQARLRSDQIMDKSQVDPGKTLHHMATEWGKDLKSSNITAREFVDLFWILAHEIVGEGIDHLIFNNMEALEEKV